jgi:hypothetical protein
VRTIRGNEYVYFWHYESRGGRSRQIHEYIGPRRNPATSRRLVDLLDAYYARMAQELSRERAAHRLAATNLR